MGRLIAIILGGAALALYVPVLLPNELSAIHKLWQDALGARFDAVVDAGAGIFAGLALILLAVRGKD